VVKHLLATNRKDFKLAADNEELLGVDDEFQFGWLEFEVGKAPATDTFCNFPVGNSDYRTCIGAKLESLSGYARLFCELYHQMVESKREALIFVHGYRHSVQRMQESIRRLEQTYIADTSGCNIGHIVMICWPSTAETRLYDEDRVRAIQTGCGAFKKLLQELRLFVNQAFKSRGEADWFVSKLNIVAASMGNRLLQATADCFDFDDTRLFNELIHTAPDVDTHQFKNDKPLKRFSQLARKVHVHFNYNDLVLELSSEVVNDFERRLGHDGPALGTNRDPHISYINVTLAVAASALDPDIILNPGDEKEFPIVHCYFTKVRTVVEDTKRIFSHKDRFVWRNDQNDSESNIERKELSLTKLVPEF